MTTDPSQAVGNRIGPELRGFAQRLLVKVVSEQDTVLLKEAFACLQAGALRAAYITTWLAIAESLKQKFKVMSDRDSEIHKIVQGIEEREEKEQAVDSYLLRKAKEIGILAPEDVARVGHIFTMRSIFAHPYHVAPSEEEVRAAMVIAVDSVLAYPPFLRHGYI